MKFVSFIFDILKIIYEIRFINSSNVKAECMRIDREQIEQFFNDRQSISLAKLEKETSIPFRKIINGNVRVDEKNMIRVVLVMKKYGFEEESCNDINSTMIKKVTDFLEFKQQTSVTLTLFRVESLVYFIKNIL